MLTRILTGLLLTLQSYALTVEVDCDRTIKDGLRPGAASANLCWLLSSDIKRPQAVSVEQGIASLGCGSLRFPYGGLSDNYLWHTAPFDDSEQGLRPRVAAMSRTPGSWDWAVNSDGSFKAAMDFDEYMALCQRLKIRPLVVVNVLSHKYEGGPSYADLKQTAVEWVRYAQRRGYEVAYWQIGNEVDLGKKHSWFSREAYVAQYADFVAAMKAVNPSIQVGPGLVGNATYFKALMEQCPELVDFTSAHQYMHGRGQVAGSYELWSQSSVDYIPTVRNMQRAVAQSAKPEMEIVITETGVTPANDVLGKVNNTYKALWWFEVLMAELSLPNVAYAYFWGLHSPWSGLQEPDSDIGLLLTLANTPKPTGQIVALVNEGLLDRMVEATVDPGPIQAYASATDCGRQVNIMLMNKSEQMQSVEILFSNADLNGGRFARTVFRGEQPDDRQPKVLQVEPIRVEGARVHIQLPALSLTLLKGEL